MIAKLFILGLRELFNLLRSTSFLVLLVDLVVEQKSMDKASKTSKETTKGGCICFVICVKKRTGQQLGHSSHRQEPNGSQND